METENFIRKPKHGDVIKVYGIHGINFGIAKSTTLIPVKRESGMVMREKVIINPTDKIYQLSETDFFFDANKVIVENY